MARVLQTHTEYAAAYLDDVIIHSYTWQQHLRWVAALLESLRRANLKKCVIGRREVRYLGYNLGGRQLRLQLDKTDPIAACPWPETKKQVRAFLGMAGYYK